MAAPKAPKAPKIPKPDPQVVSTTEEETSTPVAETSPVVETPAPATVEDVPVFTPPMEEPKPAGTENDPSDPVVDNTTITSVVFEADAAPTQPIEKMVNIKLKHPHSCFIGGTSYSFEAGKIYRAPENVKQILAGANLLDVL